MTTPAPPTPLAILSPTASGKTSLAITLAKRFDLEIINADGYQVFRHMDIGTAKPTLDELAQVPHHLIDTKNPDQEYSAHLFADDARQIIQSLAQQGRRALLVGGSGFYLRALQTDRLDVPAGTIETQDLQASWEEIIQSDPSLRKQLKSTDKYRIARALFLVRQGLCPSQVWQTQLDAPKALSITLIGIQMERTLLYQRINTRVDQMFAQGLLQETQQVLADFPLARLRLSKTIGYAQCLAHLDQQITLGEAIEQTKIKTRNYAKRQMTWIRNQTHLKRFDFENAIEEVSCYVKSII